MRSLVRHGIFATNLLVFIATGTSALATDPHRDSARNRLKHEITAEQQAPTHDVEQGAKAARQAAIPTATTVIAAPESAEPEIAPSFSPRSESVAPSVRKQHEASAILFANKKNWDEAAAHARRSGDAALQSLVEWMRLKDGDTVARLDEYAYFLNRPKEWPDSGTLLARAEEALLIKGASEAQIRKWYDYAAKIRGEERPSSGLMANFVRHAYIEGDYTTYEENLIRTRYESIIRPQDSVARADRLVWEEKWGSLPRLLQFLPASDRAMIETRAALLQEQLRARILYAGLSTAQKNNAGVLYASMRYAMKQKNDDVAEKYLLQAPKDLPYASKWWKTRASLIRDAIESGDYKHAQKLLDSAGDLTGDEKAEALFTEGWLQIEFRDNAKDAYKKFYELYNVVKFPVSKARAAYWAGVAAEKNGNKDIAQSWFTKGASYPTQFYGQLSALRLYGAAPLKLPATPAITAKDKAAIAKRPAAEAMRILSRQDEPLLADKFLGHLVDTAETDGQIAYLGAITSEGGSHYLGVKAAKRALRANVVLAQRGWPRIKVGFVPVIEPGLMFAITRQESEFRPNARSSADALGMMQLLPKTAAHTAKKNNVAYKREAQLLQPAFNMLLGTYYLGGLIDKYDGNYMLAIAAYNAGPKNVNMWLGRFGTPGKSIEQSLRWLEQIPFGETRNYVQRVLENLQVYRHLLAEGGKAPKLKLGDDLEHKTQLRELPTE